MAQFQACHPHRPTVTELRSNDRRFPSNSLHDSWADYLYWTASWALEIFGAQRAFTDARDEAAAECARFIGLAALDQ